MPRSWPAFGLALVLAGCAGEQTGLGLNLVSPQEVQQLGLQEWRDLRAKTPAVADQAEQQRARKIADSLLKAAGENPAAWEVVVFQGHEANAFALPAKKIGVYDGMMKLADTDAQLAAVLGHEIGHVEKNHSAERMSSAIAAQTGEDIAGAALAAAGLGSPQTVAAVLGLGAQYGLLLPYSRNQELEADGVGLHLMAEAGYDPRAAITLWQKMRQVAGGSPAFLSTHPAPDDRIRQMEAQMPQALAEYGRH
jgi:predicted Zn-dependent protease